MKRTIFEKVNRILPIMFILILVMTACKPNVGRLLDKGDVEELIAALSYERDPEIRAEAALALSELDEVEAIDPMIALLSDDEDETVRSATAKALGQICIADTVQPLIDALEDESEEVQESAISALVMCGDVAVGSLLETLESDNDHLRQSVVKVLAQMGTAVSSDLAKLLSNPDDNVRSGAYDALLMIGSPAVSDVIEAVKESTRVVYKNAIFTASAVMFGPDGTAEGALAVGGRCTKNGNWEGKIVLCDIGKNSYAEKIQIVQESGGVGVIFYNSSGGNIYPSLTNMSNDVNIVSVGVSQENSQLLLNNAVGSPIQIISERASEAIALLEAFGESAIPELIDAVKDPTIDKMSASFLFQKILGSMGSSTIPLVAEMLDDSDAAIRFNAVNILGQIVDERATALIIESLDDPDKSVRYKAIKALGNLRAIEAVEPLVASLSDEEMDIQLAALDALTDIGSPAVDLLMEMYHDPTETDKGSVASALKGIFGETADVVAEMAMSVCMGGSLTDATEYSRNEGDTHPSIIIDEDGMMDSWTYQLPVEWLPFTPDMLQLVVCLGEEEKLAIQVCQYSYSGSGADAPDITRYQYERDVAIYEAFTGEFLGSTTLIGSVPDNCPQVTSSSTTAIYGEKVEISDLANWLSMFGIPLAE